MNRKVLVICLAFTVLNSTAALAQFWELPARPNPSEYGNLLINRISTMNRQLPVAFSHWSHRRHFTCRVCHFELDIAMKVNTTEITEEQNRNGLYCGACHDGKTAFGHTEKHCAKCHNGDITYGKKNFDILSYLPESPFGNKVDWVKALEEGAINPKQSLYEEDYTPMEYGKVLELKAKWTMVPPAIFSHEVHNQWLDCSNCHPDIFNIEQQTTEHFEMQYILEGKFCGLCHLRMAFPIDDCRRCHVALRK